MAADIGVEIEIAHGERIVCSSARFVSAPLYRFSRLRLTRWRRGRRQDELAKVAIPVRRCDLVVTLAHEVICADTGAQQEEIVRDEITMDGVAPAFSTVNESTAWLAKHDLFVDADQQPGLTIIDAQRALLPAVILRPDDELGGVSQRLQ
ncbi:MAG: hypothetical protein V4693_03165 [Pseudomonadota bacterium]